MKRFHQIPKLYQNLSIGMLSALIMVSVGLFVNAILPNPKRGSSDAQPNAETASGISVTPVSPDDKPYTPPPIPGAPTSPASPSSSAPAASTTPMPTPTPVDQTAQGSPISPEALAGSPEYPVTSAEPYDDLFSTKFSHFSYAQADSGRIESVGLFVREGYEREEFLDYEAAAAFNQMKAAAAAEGVSLLPISGFRTIDHQAELFEKQVEKQGSEAAAAQLSAPPGHSEHHTGYAIDIGDANSPDTDIKYSFEQTPAYAWLKANAKRYGFEESFPSGNQQGVSFEPWHWRFVASERAENVFINSRSSFPIP